MWSDVRSNYPIFFFDSTGTICRSIANQSDPNFFSMSFYDRQRKKYIPLFEFITTDGTQVSVSQYLTSAFFVISDYSINYCRKPFFSGTITVTDQSTVLINSVCEVFNKCTQAQYLQWSYNILLGSKNNQDYFDVMNTIVYICSTHLLNTIKIKTKKIIKHNEKTKAKKVFLSSFGLVQNSTSILQIEKYIKHIYNVFNTKFIDNSIIESLSYLKEEIENRNLENLPENSISKQEKNKDQASDNFNYLIKCESQNELYSSSPFRIYFEEFFVKIRKEKHNYLETVIRTEKEKTLNEFYFPDLIILIEERMYYVPLWTGLMLQIFQNNKKLGLGKLILTRLTNNPGEGRFNIVKNNIFKKERKKKRRLSLSQVTSKIQYDLKATFKNRFK